MAGAVTGTVLYTQVIQKKSSKFRPMGGAANLPRPDFWKWMGDRLELTQEQREKIEEIVNDSQERLRPLRELIDPIMQDELKRVHDEICKVLTPQQKEKYEDFLKHRFSRRPESGPPGPGGPPPGRPPGFKPQEQKGREGRPRFDSDRQNNQPGFRRPPPDRGRPPFRDDGRVFPPQAKPEDQTNPPTTR